MHISFVKRQRDTFNLNWGNKNARCVANMDSNRLYRPCMHCEWNMVRDIHARQGHHEYQNLDGTCSPLASLVLCNLFSRQGSATSLACHSRTWLRHLVPHVLN